MALAPKAIIASFTNDDRTRALQLLANGSMVEITRETPSDVWSPPEDVGKLTNCIGSFEAYLVSLARA